MGVTLSLDDLIAARATPPGAGALAVVRMSGVGALGAAAAVFRGREPVTAMDGYRGQHGWIHAGGRAVDEVVLWVYRAPRSYTGEDMVEVSCHGGEVSARRVLDALLEAGARPAQPGEFTRRAFLNGRIDLAQAEAVAEVIAARGERAHGRALSQLRGGFSRRVQEHAARIRDVLVRIEAHLDFGEDVPEAPDAGRLAGEVRAAEKALREWIDAYGATRGDREGYRVAIAGRPNVGKSSLLNALVGADRALVHDRPGTTRDLVEARVEWDGMPVHLVDTAGLRETPEPVERAGIGRAYHELDRADRILWVVDGSRDPDAEDRRMAGEMDPSRTRVVINKIDLGKEGPAWGDLVPPEAAHRTSAISGEGIGDLIRGMVRELGPGGNGGDETEGATSERHVRHLRSAADALGRARGVLEAGHTLELGAADLHRALDDMAAITGERAEAAVLDEIFRRFCIGK